MPQGAAAAERIIRVEGVEHHFPADATDDDISQALAAEHDQPRPNDPNSIISGPEPGFGGSINRLSAKVKGWLGGNKPERGSGSGAVDLLGGPALGPLKMAHGTTQLTTHPVKGLNEIVRGGVQTAALPLSMVAPSAAPMSLPYAAGGAVVNKAAQYLGADSDTAELAGNIAVGAAAGRGPLTRTVGRGIQKVGSLPDLPTNIPLSPKTNILLSAMNSVKSGMGGVGRKMANYGIPQAPNVAPGPGEPPPEADLPAIRPDESSHYNDVQDQGESNRLMDAVRGHDFIKPSDRSPVQPSSNSQYDDVSVEPGIGPEMTTTKMVGPIHRPPQLPSRMFHGTNADFVHNILSEGIQPQDVGANEVAGPYITGRADIARNFMPPSASPVQRHATLSLDIPNKELGSQDLDTLGIFGDETARDMGGRIIPSSRISGVSYDPPIELPESSLTKSRPSSSTPLADSTPTPNSNTLLRAIQSAPGWPENGLPNKPWSDILNKEDFVHKHIAPESTDSDYPGRVFDQASKKFAGNEGVIQGSVKLPGDNDEITFPLGGRRTYGFTDRNFSSLDEAQATADYLNKHPGYGDARVRDHLEESGGKYRSEYPYGVEWGRRPVDESNHRTLGQSLGYSDESINDFISWKAEDELPDALSTDPYNRPPERQIQDPSYQGPERRQSPRTLIDDLSRGGQESSLTNRMEGLPDQWSKLGVDPDSFFKPAHPAYTPENVQDWLRTFGDRAERSGFKNWVSQGKPGLRSQADRPGLAETTAASDPTGDGQALEQARQELPNGTLSDHLQRAAQIAAQRRNE